MKSTEHYIALAATMLLVALQHKEKPWLARLGIAGASGGLGFGVAPEVAASVSWLGEVTAMVGITALIYAVLDAVGALIADRDAIRTIFLRVGGKK